MKREKKLKQKDVEGLDRGRIRLIPQKEIERIYHEETQTEWKELARKNRDRMEKEK